MILNRFLDLEMLHYFIVDAIQTLNKLLLSKDATTFLLCLQHTIKMVHIW